MEDDEKGMSRRSFVKKSAVGAAGVAAVAAMPTLLTMTENAQAGLPSGDPTAPLMAYVRDASSGTVVVMWGTKEFVAKDTALVSRLATYTRG
ncbi:MAG TPA: twin-arginine translocation signal domain-containing protein [Thermoplasmata archaeon]